MIVVFPISEFVKITEDEEIKVYEIPGGKMVKIIHKGPYEECAPTYEKKYFPGLQKMEK
ncbi:GyrI-like domain-containing protein [Methanosarcina sp.]|uniref:GyrI-like domain-containing protein n=1 Tax=Methanosarcina sp. TaxID=2213 RepID=UPI0029897395|nr:GyrI-like domain-containing protein [Methanosarcina sp.]MDW5549533.1 GyrI-like domain-containing protein [Methanosarcina sp.]MDW5558629.1 GyrI-like domain-containing protein [Methanosarcina sp.]